MALKIRYVTNLKGDLVPQVLSPGTIYQLFNHLKKTRRDYAKFQKSIGNKDKTPEEKARTRQTWMNRSRYLTLLDE